MLADDVFNRFDSQFIVDCWATEPDTFMATFRETKDEAVPLGTNWFLDNKIVLLPGMSASQGWYMAAIFLEEKDGDKPLTIYEYGDERSPEETAASLKSLCEGYLAR